MEAKCGGLARSAGIQMYEGNKVKYKVKRSIHEVNGPWTDYKSRADNCQEVTMDNSPLNSDIFNNFNKP